MPTPSPDHLTNDGRFVIAIRPVVMTHDPTTWDKAIRSEKNRPTWVLSMEPIILVRAHLAGCIIGGNIGRGLIGTGIEVHEGRRKSGDRTL